MKGFLSFQRPFGPFWRSAAFFHKVGVVGGEREEEGPRQYPQGNVFYDSGDDDPYGLLGRSAAGVSLLLPTPPLPKKPFWVKRLRAPGKAVCQLNNYRGGLTCVEEDTPS